MNTASCSGATASAAAQGGTLDGIVVTYNQGGLYTCRHEQETRAALAKRLALIKNFSAPGEYDPADGHSGPIYFLPADTLVGLRTLEALGIRDERDLFGGAVPYAFVATKAITHGLIGPDAFAPIGWSDRFGEAVRDVTLRGFSAFTIEDARRAGLCLFRHGPLRLKLVRATAGRGQTVIVDAAGLESALACIDSIELGEYGLVLEENLTDVTTYSVGQVRVADLVATYYGTQQATPDNDGASVYGGSSLVVARGGFEALDVLIPSADIRLAVAQARTYDTAATECFPGRFASRRNYDVARGVAADGRARCGVLEQSWRAGGASGAEIAALQAFQADPSLQAVRAATVERYGHGDGPPPGAIVYFNGVDEQTGPLIKYATVEPLPEADPVTR